jgi:hypothetical protein
MIIPTGKFAGVIISAVPADDLPLVAHEARRGRDRRLLRAIESEIARRGRRREQTRRSPRRKKPRNDLQPKN